EAHGRDDPADELRAALLLLRRADPDRMMELLFMLFFDGDGRRAMRGTALVFAGVADFEEVILRRARGHVLDAPCVRSVARAARGRRRWFALRGLSRRFRRRDADAAERRGD